MMMLHKNPAFTGLRNRTLISVFYLLVICFLTMPLLAQDKVGTAVAPFLNIPTGARSAALGAAVVSMPGDVSVLFVNPAGLTSLNGNEFDFSAGNWFVGSALSSSSALLSTGSHRIAISVKQLDYGSEIVTTVAEPEGTGETWSARDQAFLVTYATGLTDRFSIGGNFKYIQQEIYHERAGTIALDLGLLYSTGFHGVNIGMSIANFGLDAALSGKDLLQTVDIDPVNGGNNENISAELSTDPWPLPLLFTVAVSADIVNREKFVWRAGVDALHPNSSNSYLKAGTEITLMDLISLRAGHPAIFKNYAEEGFAYGIGIMHTLAGMRLNMDLSAADYGRLGMVRMWSVSLGI